MPRHPRTRRLASSSVLATLLAVALFPATALGAGLASTGEQSARTTVEAAGGAPTKVIVTFRSKPGASAEHAVTSAGGSIRFRYSIIPAMAATVPETAIEGLRHNPLVKAVELDAKVHISSDDTATGDLEYDNAWGVRHIETKRVHDAGIRGQGVKVAVIDSGIDYVHYNLSGPQPVYPEFNGTYRGGWDFVNNDADPLDDNGHGTHVSGILAADHNGYLVTGVAPGVELYSLKVVDSQGNGDYSSVIAALDWAATHDIDVVNMSIGGHEASQALADAVEAAYHAGVLMVAASGNINPLSWTELIFGCPVAYPAAYPHVLATTFTNMANELTGFSCTGSQVDFAAPGDNIYAPVPVGTSADCMFCSPYGYAAESGTSMASPHLAGVVALVLSHGIADANGDGLLFDEVKAHLCANTDIGGRIATTDTRYPSWYGCGVINAGKALVDNPPGGGSHVNVPPTAVDDTASTAWQTAVSIPVLANDSDSDGGTLTVTAVTTPAHGTAAIDAGATSVTYTPAVGYSGADSFGYTISDGQGGSASANVTLTVGAKPNDPPSAVDDTMSTPWQTAVSIPVLVNDSDPDGGTLTVTAVTTPGHGTAVIDAGATSVTYTPAAGYSGADSFGYTISDGQGGSASATVSMTVGAKPNDPPSAVDDTASTAWQTPVTIDVLANDSDPDGGTLTISSVTTPAHGTAVIAGDAASVTYTPAAGYSGPDSFGYTITDGQGGSASATVNVTVGAKPNSPPTATNDSATTPYQTAILINVLANDSDSDGGTLSITSVTTPAHGTAVINVAKTAITYTPAAGYSGADSFGYTISDGQGGTASATVSVTVGSAPAASVMHIGDLDRAASKTTKSWTAQVTVLVVDQLGRPVAGATVTGSWSGAAKGTGSCITGSTGTCTIAKFGLALAKTSITFTVTSVTKTGLTYDRTKNVDPDGDSTGTAITITRP